MICVTVKCKYEKVSSSPPDVWCIELTHNGTIINSELYLHGVANNDKTTWAGHILDGCRVSYLAEIVVQEVITGELTRKADEHGVCLISREQD